MKKLLFLGGILCLPLSGFAAVLFDQTTNYEVNGWFSDAVSTGGSQFYGQSMADNFSLADDSTVTSIEFWGASENAFNDDLSNFSSFDVVIYDTSFNAVASYSIATASLSPVTTGSTGGFSGATGYKFTAVVNESLSAGSYFLHVGSVNVDSQSDAFDWSMADGDSLLSTNVFLGNGWEEGSIASDVAFRINGTADTVPEPASLAILGLGALALIRRRKNA